MVFAFLFAVFRASRQGRTKTESKSGEILASGQGPILLLLLTGPQNWVNP
jgi:hypothetical protein